MSNTNFVIPIKFEDLYNPSGDIHVYKVQIEYNEKEIGHKLKDSFDSLKKNGAEYIIQDFDVFYSYLKHFDTIDVKTKDEGWKIIYRTLDSLYKNLEQLLSEHNTSQLRQLDENEKLKICNSLKMIVYLFCKIVEAFEDQDIKAQMTANAADLTKKGKKTTKRTEESYDWQNNKERGFEVLVKVFSLSLHRVFTPPVVEDEFVSLITKCAFKILENPVMTKQKDLSLQKNIFDILGLSVERHRQSLSFCLKIIQMLQHNENVVSIVASLVETIVKQHNQNTLITEIVREIRRIDIKELSKDASAPRAISAFVIELCERCTDQIMQTSSDLLMFLDEDSYLMRNAILNILGQLIVKKLSGNQMTTEERERRDEFLDLLQDHIFDNTGWTRSSALKEWTKICIANAIPITRQENLLKIVVGRLRDKSCYVRKAAVQFLTQFLLHNPFGAKFPMTILDQSLKAENDHLAELEKMLEAEKSGGKSDEKVDKNKDPSLTEEENQMETESIDKKAETEDQETELNNDMEESVDNQNSNESMDSNFENLARLVIENNQTASQSGTRIEIAEINVENLKEEVRIKRTLVKYLGDMLKVTKQFHIAIPLVCDLLSSKNITDVQEAIEFFVCAHKFAVENAIIGIKKMIVLVLSKEKSIKDLVVSAYERIYLDTTEIESENSNNKALAIVKKLCDLVKQANTGVLVSLEELLKEFKANDKIGNTHIKVMFDLYSQKYPATTTENSIAAVQLIGMLASYTPELARDNLEPLINVGLGDRGLNNCRLACETCVAIGKCFKRPTVENCEMFFKLPKDDLLFTKISQLLFATFTNSSSHWIMMCAEFIKVIFLLAEKPDLICEEIIRQLLEQLLNSCETRTEQISSQTNQIETDETEKTDINEGVGEGAGEGGEGAGVGEGGAGAGAGEGGEGAGVGEGDAANIISQETDNLAVTNALGKLTFIKPELLVRFITLLGDVAMNLLVHLELNVFTELKIRNKLKEDKENKKRTLSKTPKRKSKSHSFRASMGGDQNLEEEIGLGGANAIEDQEQEYLYGVCNQEIVMGDNLLAKLSEIVISIAKNPTLYPVRLRNAATLTLAKFMALSENFCRIHLRLLVTIMERSAEAIIRANSVIALGDLCNRFPNLLDSWSQQMFLRLRDPEIIVKMSALKVVTRLILSDILKVKGQISEIALLIVDENEELSSSSRLFFIELSKKQRSIYNVLPDLISHLSDTESGLEEDKFRTVMKYCFDLIEKDRESVCLVEKLCQRFRTTTDERQWRDLAYCLGLLNYSEKSIYKLYENMICFADKLYNEAVYENITLIIANARKLQENKNKPELKQTLDEFEQKITECRNKGINEDASEFQKVVGTPNTPSKRQRPQASTVKKQRVPHGDKRNQKQKKKPNKKQKHNSEDEEDFVEENEVVEENQVAKGRERRPQRETRTRKKIVEWSDDDSDDE